MKIKIARTSYLAITYNVTLNKLRLRHNLVVVGMVVSGGPESEFNVCTVFWTWYDCVYHAPNGNGHEHKSTSQNRVSVPVSKVIEAVVWHPQFTLEIIRNSKKKIVSDWQIILNETIGNAIIKTQYKIVGCDQLTFVYLPITVFSFS